MDFQQLVSKMSELDTGSSATTEQTTTECPGAMPANMPETAPPNMSVNFNAQGMDNIEQIMKLFQKINPEPAPPVPAEPKMLPLPMDTADTDEAYSNEPNEVEFELDDVTFGGNDLHKRKGTYPKVAGGDNPMQEDSAQEYIRSVKKDLSQGADPKSLEAEFFNNLSMYGMSSDRIADMWEKMTSVDVPGMRTKPSDDFKSSLKDLVKQTSDNDDPEELERLRRQAKTGGLKTDTTGFGAELESTDLRAKIREELSRRLAEAKAK